MDIYAFGAVLVEIAEWAPLADILRKKVALNEHTSTEDISKAKEYLLHRNMAFRMGSIYRQVTIDCRSIV